MGVLLFTFVLDALLSVMVWFLLLGAAASCSTTPLDGLPGGVVSHGDIFVSDELL